MAKRVILCLLLSLSLWAEGSLLLVLHKGGSSLGFYTPEGRLLASVPVGRHPHEMVLSADGRLVYVTDNGTMRIEDAGKGGNTVSVVDIAARKKIGEISLGEFRRPHGIDLDRRTGRLFVSCELPDRLLMLDSARRAVLETFDTKGKTSHMVALGQDARWAYVSNSGSSQVAAVELATGNVKLIPTAARPEGSVLSKDGRKLYVAGREGRKITVVDTARNEVEAEIASGNGPVRIGLTPDGKTLAYALMHDHAVEFADPAARKVIGSVKLAGPPVSLSISPDGKRAYASVQEQDTVCVVSIPDRKVVRTFRTAAGAAPDPVLEIPAR